MQNYPQPPNTRLFPASKSPSLPTRPDQLFALLTSSSSNSGRPGMLLVITISGFVSLPRIRLIFRDIWGHPYRWGISDLVSVSHAERLYDWAIEPKDLLVFEHGDHNTILAANQEAYFAAVGTFIRNLRMLLYQSDQTFV